MLKETKVGKKLSDLTTQRVITLVLSIMFSIPLFSADTYVETVTSYPLGLGNIAYWKNNVTLLEKAFDDYVSFHKELRSPVIYVELYPSTGVTHECC